MVIILDLNLKQKRQNELNKYLFSTGFKQQFSKFLSQLIVKNLFKKLNRLNIYIYIYIYLLFNNSCC